MGRNPAPERPCIACFKPYKPINGKRLRCEPCHELHVARICPTCNQAFVANHSRNVFCSKSCAARLNNVKVPKRARPREACRHCGKEMTLQNKRFCSRVCNGAYGRERRIAQWLAGELDASRRDGNLSSWARTYLLNEAGHACTQCGWSVPNPVLGVPILTVNHIDGDWKNNRRENLEVLCYNCHTLTPPFGALNVGSTSGRRPWAGRVELSVA